MLAQLNLTGSHFDIGVALGQFGQQAFHQYRRQSDVWQALQAFKGHPRFLNMVSDIGVQHPEYLAELEGLAVGLGVSKEETLLWNCRGDLVSHTPDGCTTVQWPSDRSIIAHNEDGDPRFRGTCAIAQVAVHGKAAFTTFVYPGSLAGHTFAVTENGLALAVNNLRGKNPGSGLPRMVAVRALLDQPNREQAIEYLQGGSYAGGFHLTLGQAGCADLDSVEFHADHCSVLKQHALAAHANHMIHPAMRDLPQVITASSQQRQDLAQDLVTYPDPIKPLSILWNDQNTTHPIFRASAHDSDQENTLATVHMVITTHHIDWRIYDGQHTEPLYRLIDHRWQTDD